MFKPSLLLALPLVVLLALSARGEDPPKSQPKPLADEAKEDKEAKQTSFWMEKKLEYSQNILSGLATGDFESVHKNADTMRKLSEIESFVRRRTPGYRRQLDFFLYANEELVKQAEAENVDGAALAFTQLTMSCVNCHKLLRAAEK